MEENDVGRMVVDAAIAVHRELGPGLLETVYEIALAHELRQRGLKVQRQQPVSISYRGMHFDEGFRLDLSVASRVVIEIKTVESLNNSHRKQLLTYLRLTDMRLGYLVNFAEYRLKDGIVRIVNGLDD